MGTVTRDLDREHWAVPMVAQLAAAVDALPEPAFETLALVHGPAVSAVMNAYRPDAVPAITTSIVGRQAWHDVFDLADALDVPVPA